MGKGGPFHAEILHVFRRPHMSRRAPLPPLLEEPRERYFFSCFLGQLKLSIDAQDRVLLLHSEYDYAGSPREERRGSFLPGAGQGVVSLWYLFFSYSILPFVP